MNKPKFKKGDVVYGNENSSQYGITRPNTLWVVKEYFSYDNLVDDMSVVEYTGRNIPGFNKVRKTWTQDEFHVDVDCFDIVNKENEHLLHLLQE